jgi:glycosyltransferase involved in cell wall biosynthesis
MPKVSVIVPNYNHAAYLRQRLQSILDQTFQDFDLTYLDDASTDSSNAVFAEFVGEASLKEHCQQHVNSIYNETNSGSPFKQWNKGVRATQGEYIWIAESDDFADPQFLATMVPILDNHPHVGIAYCQSCQIDSNNVTISPSLSSWVEDLNPDRWLHDFVADGTIECQKYLVVKNTIPNASAVLIRRSVYEAIGGAEESLFLTGDWMTWIKILLRSDLAFCTQTLNNFRTHKTSVRSRSVLNGKQAYEYLLICDFIEQHVTVPASVLTEIKEEIIADWINLIFDAENTIDFQARMKFYRLAKNSIPQTELVFLKQLASYTRNQLALKIKQWLPKSAIAALKELKLNSKSS